MWAERSNLKFGDGRRGETGSHEDGRKERREREWIREKTKEKDLPNCTNIP